MRNPWNAKRAGEHLTNAIRDRIEAAYVNGDQEEMDALEAEYDRYDRIHTYWEPDVSESSDEALFAGLTAACQASDDSLLHLLNLDGHSHVRLLEESGPHRKPGVYHTPGLACWIRSKTPGCVI